MHCILTLFKHWAFLHSITVTFFNCSLILCHSFGVEDKQVHHSCQVCLWFNKVLWLCVFSFQAKEARSSLKRRLDGRLSRTSSTEREPAGESESKKESDENKENWRLDEYLNDQDSWNESVISGRHLDWKYRWHDNCVTFICLLWFMLDLKDDKSWTCRQWTMKQHNLCWYLFTARAWQGDLLWRRAADRLVLSFSGRSTSVQLA